MDWLSDPLSLPYFQRALAEVLLLSVACGLLGAWVVLRRLAFFSHGVGTATFPGLVVAGPWGLAPQVAGLACGLVFAGATERLSARTRLGTEAATGLGLVGALAIGVVLASDVYESGSGVDRLLFGTLLGVTDSDLWISAGAAALGLAATLAFGRSWLASGFDPAAAGTLGVRVRGSDLALLAVLTAVVVASVDAVGALLAGALVVTPAACARLFARTAPELIAGAVAVAAALGLVGLYLADAMDAPPGPAIAVLGGVVYAVAAVTLAVRSRSAVPALDGPGGAA